MAAGRFWHTPTAIFFICGASSSHNTVHNAIELFIWWLGVYAADDWNDDVFFWCIEATTAAGTAAAAAVPLPPARPLLCATWLSLGYLALVFFCPGLVLALP